MRLRLFGALTAAALIGAFAIPAHAGTLATRIDIRKKAFKITPMNVLIAGGAGEPFAAISPTTQHLFICEPGAGVVLLRSTDYKTFSQQTITNTGGGGDCDVKVGPDGAVYTADLQLFGSAIRKSTDDGKTFGAAVEDPVEQDRQWLAPDPKDPNTVYFGYHDFVAEAEVVAKSTDGGAHFLIHSIASTDPLLAPDTYPNTFQGPVVVGPSNTQNVYIVYGISDAQTNAGTCPPPPSKPLACPFGSPHTVVVARSSDGGVTFADTVAMDFTTPGVLGQLFPWMSVDSAGNLYVAAAGYKGVDAAGKPVNNGMWFAASKDHGATWSQTFKVNKGAGGVVFPTVVAGTPGIADFSWIESTAASENDTTGVWTVHFAQSRNTFSSNPTFTEVTGPIIRHGAVCVSGIACTGNRDLLDFMGLALDSFGYAHMAVQSTEGGEHLVYWRQDAGPSATTLPCKPKCVYKRPYPKT